MAPQQREFMPRHPDGAEPPPAVADGFRYRISVITPVTRPHMLDVAYASLVQQLETLPDHIEIEWVLKPDRLIDDELRAVLNGFGQQPERLIIKQMDAWQKEGVGPAILRNYMVSIGATGQLVCTLDDDDALLYGSLAIRIAPFFWMPEIGWTAGGVQKWKPRDAGRLPLQSELDGAFPTGAKPGYLTREAAAKLVVNPPLQFVGAVMPQGMMLRRHVWLTIGGDVAAIVGEDMKRADRATLFVPGFVVAQGVMALRENPDSLTTSNWWDEVRKDGPADRRQYGLASISTGATTGELSPLWLASGTHSGIQTRETLG